MLPYAISAASTLATSALASLFSSGGSAPKPSASASASTTSKGGADMQALQGKLTRRQTSAVISRLTTVIGQLTGVIQSLARGLGGASAAPMPGVAAPGASGPTAPNAPTTPGQAPGGVGSPSPASPAAGSGAAPVGGPAPAELAPGGAGVVPPSSTGVGPAIGGGLGEILATFERVISSVVQTLVGAFQSILTQLFGSGAGASGMNSTGLPSTGLDSLNLPGGALMGGMPSVFNANNSVQLTQPTQPSGISSIISEVLGMGASWLMDKGLGFGKGLMDKALGFGKGILAAGSSVVSKVLGKIGF